MIRRATPADADAIFHVHDRAIRDRASSEYTCVQTDAWAERSSQGSYRDPASTQILLVATEGESICGFGQLDLKSSTVDAVYVLPGAWRRGVGSRLLAQLEAVAVAEGVSELTLDASLNSIAFYESAGYERVSACDHQLEPGVFIPCMVMRKELAALAAD